jgi:hypothetical protein
VLQVRGEAKLKVNLVKEDSYMDYDEEYEMAVLKDLYLEKEHEKNVKEEVAIYLHRQEMYGRFSSQAHQGSTKAHRKHS